MKMINTKLALSVLAIAMLATPAFAAKRHVAYHGLQNSVVGSAPIGIGVYPNGATRTGSAYSLDSGAADNVIR